MARETSPNLILCIIHLENNGTVVLDLRNSRSAVIGGSAPGDHAVSIGKTLHTSSGESQYIQIMPVFPDQCGCLIFCIDTVFDTPGVLPGEIFFLSAVIKKDEVTVRKDPGPVLIFEIKGCIFRIFANIGEFIILAAKTS